MRKFVCIFFAVLMLFSLCGCKAEEGKGIKIVTTVFPPYDFAKAIAGEAEMLIPAGSESHYFEPSLSDIAKIRSADLFIYAGDSIDPWAEKVLSSIEGSEVKILKMSDYVNLLEEESAVPGEHTHSHEETMDEHIWTSPKNAIIITQKIAETLCEIDSDNTEKYNKNCEDYVNQLKNLDRELENTVSDGETKTLVFADRFPFRYMAHDYNLECFAAFSGCSTDTEPTLQTVKSLVEKIMSENLPAVIITETTKGSVASAIADKAGVKILTMNSCHNVSAKEKENGATYIDLMNENIKVLREALMCR